MQLVSKLAISLLHRVVPWSDYRKSTVNYMAADRDNSGFRDASQGLHLAPSIILPAVKLCGLPDLRNILLTK